MTDALGQFAIGFDDRDRGRLHALWDEVLDSQQWAEGGMVARFEELWARRHGVGAVALSSWTGGALAALRFAGVGPGDVVLCPSNTFMATPLAALNTGAEVAFVDCGRDDLCISLAEFEREDRRPPAARRVPGAHRRAHGVRDEAIAELCEPRACS